MKAFFDLKMKLLILALALLTGLLMFIGPGGALDTRLFYTAAEAQEFFAQLLPLEVFNYFRTECIDLVFYIPVYSCILWIALKRLYPHKSWHKYSVAVAIFDVYETLNILLFLSLEKPLPSYLGFVTCAKWISTAVFLALISRGLYGKLRQAGRGHVIDA